MSGLRIGSLFSGYRGLDMAVEAALDDAHTVWTCENDPDAAAILTHHWPDVPNLGDITKVDWSQVEPVDVLAGGFPCQDLSHAGKRLGLRPGTRSGLWSHFAYAISQLRPSLVVVENVRGLLSASAHSDLEPCPWCVGDDEDSALRALGAVLGDLAELGYDARWGSVRASDAGAPHGRRRVFIVAARDTEGDDLWHDTFDGRSDPRRAQESARGSGSPTPDAGGGSLPWAALGDHGLRIPAERGGVAAPDPGGERHGRGEDGRGVGRVDGPDAGRPQERERAREVAGDRGAAAAADADGFGLQGVRGIDAGGRDADGCGGADVAWGDYEPAIRRWERLTRPVPAPTEPGAKGQPRLAPRFVEWMMGLPAGHVIDVPIPRNAQLKALGNGVVPQQAELALRWLLHGQWCPPLLEHVAAEAEAG